MNGGNMEDNSFTRLPGTFKVEGMWLPLGCNHLEKEEICFSASPYMHFKPRGLMFWDLPPDAGLISCQIFNREVILVGHGPLPAKVFARAQSYEAVKARVEKGEELFNEWIAAPAMSPANTVRIILATQFVHGFINTKAAFWGHAVVY